MKRPLAFVFTLFILIVVYPAVPTTAQMYPGALYSGLDFINYKTGKQLLKAHHVKSMTIWSNGTKSMRGHADSVKEQMIEFDREGNITSRTLYDRSHEWFKYNYKYNSNGKLVYYELFTRGKPTESISFVMNDLGLSDYSIHSSRGISDSTHYFWSENHRSAESKRYSPWKKIEPNPSTKYTLDSLQNIIEDVTSPEDDLTYRHVNKFNEAGHPIETIRYWGDGKKESIKYLYDSVNRLVTLEYPSVKILYKYSVDGLLSESVSESNNKMITRFTYEFY